VLFGHFSQPGFAFQKRLDDPKSIKGLFPFRFT
jgi:hypothetical protein